jgi:hypothetical protein
VAMTAEAAAQPESPRRSRALRSVAKRLDHLAERLDNGHVQQQPSARSQAFWPYGTRAAITCVVGLWVVLGVLAYLFNRYLGWPTQSSENHVFYVATVVGLLPLALVVLDVVARTGGAVDLRGFKIDFSSSMVHTELQLAPNLGQPGPVVSDTAAANIMEALRTSAAHDALRIDLDATWWLTRLLALSAGAKRAGSPRALVFVRSNEDGRQAFVGWAAPEAVLNALLAMRPAQFRSPYAQAEGIAYQLAAFGRPELRPPPPYVWPPDVLRYLNDARYNELGFAALEHVLLDRLAPLEAHDPEQLNFAELRTQLGDSMVTDRLELTDPPENQIRALLQSSAPFIALVRTGEYKAIMQRDDAERDILRQLAQPAATAA